VIDLEHAVTTANHRVLAMTTHRRQMETRRHFDTTTEGASVMTNEDFVRRTYDVAEVKDIPGWIACFNPDGVFIDNSVGITYRAPDEVAIPVENYGRAFSNMHRELFDVYVSGDIVIVQLALQGTHDGSLSLPQGFFRQRGTGWTRPAATSSSSRTVACRCSTAVRRER
jgi:SnoaL-like domain